MVEQLIDGNDVDRIGARFTDAKTPARQSRILQVELARPVAQRCFMNLNPAILAIQAQQATVLSLGLDCDDASLRVRSRKVHAAGADVGAGIDDQWRRALHYARVKPGERLALNPMTDMVIEAMKNLVDGAPVAHVVSAIVN